MLKYIPTILAQFDNLYLYISQGEKDKIIMNAYV